ncbi:MAG TPA: XdhC/CoxI family protein [Polyangiaceae bacterium]|nr:XdhC/CoxI family protein [Polyangiaceae bacterium]
MSYDTDQVLERAAAWRAEGRKIAIATVVRTWGSSPRPPGSKLAVNDRGEFVGSVSGGCIEPAVMHEARAVMAGAGPKVLEFGVSNEAAWEVGLACGGRVQIYVEAPKAELLERLLRDVRAQRPAVLVTWLASGEQSLSHPDEAPPLSGALPPSRPGAPPPSAPAGAPPSAGGPAGAALEAELDDAARRALAADESLVVESGARGEALVEPFNPPLRLLVVGAVHIAQPLAKMATEAGFSVVVIDPRKAFASEERFGGVRCVRAWPDEALASLAPDRRTAVVTLTHDPKLDDPALEAALRSPAFFVGCLGSQKTHRARLERLGARGFGGAELARLHGPVGLRIGAKTPAEIAVSVLAQIVERLRAGSP